MPVYPVVCIPRCVCAPRLIAHCCRRGCPIPDGDAYENLRSSEAISLDWKDPTAYLEPAPAPPDKSAAAQADSDGETPSSTLTLAKCLDAYTRTEYLGADERWMCDRCKAPSRGLKTVSLWRAPDVLVVRAPHAQLRRSRVQQQQQQ